MAAAVVARPEPAISDLCLLHAMMAPASARKRANPDSEDGDFDTYDVESASSNLRHNPAVSGTFCSWR